MGTIPSTSPPLNDKNFDYIRARTGINELAVDSLSIVLIIMPINNEHGLEAEIVGRWRGAVGGGFRWD